MSKNKRKRTVMTVVERVKCIRLSDEGHKVAKIQEILKVGKTQVYDTLKNREKILADYNAGALPGQRKLLIARRTKYSGVNERVLEWILCCCSKNFPLTGQLIREKAASIALSMGIDKFEASTGWLQKFLIRNQLSSAMLCGEGAEVKPETVSDWKAKLPGLIEGYSPDDIYNCDETGLLFRMLPSRSYISEADPAKKRKLAKDRITVLLAGSMSGEKLRPLVIGKSANPWNFSRTHKRQVEVTYESNKKAWMTSEIFTRWLNRLNNKMVLQNRKILLFLDNCGAHPPASLSNIKLLFFPPNNTPHFQPMDAGIIQAMKLYYRKCMLRKILIKLDECNTPSDLVKQITIQDAIHWLQMAWLKVKKSTVSKCFAKTGFLHSKSSAQLELKSNDINAVDEEEWDEKDLILLRKVVPNVTKQDLLDVDCDLAVTKEYTSEEIESFLASGKLDSESEEEDIYAEIPEIKPPSSKEVMEMASKILLYANSSPNIPEDQREMYVEMASKLHDTQANIVIRQMMETE